MNATAREVWMRLDAKRQQVLIRARECSALTIPALLPPDGHTDNDPLPTPYQSLGARGVNNVASKLLLTLLPPGGSMFRYEISPGEREALVASGALADAEERLAAMEHSVTRKIESSGARPVAFEALKHLATTGNVLLQKVGSDGLKLYRLDQYVISRAPDGKPLQIVIKTPVMPQALPEETRAACKVDVNSDQPVDVYTHIRWQEGRVIEYQEINGYKVPGSDGNVPEERSDWIPLRWTAVPGNDYGRGLVEEVIGDLRSLEGIYEAIVLAAAASAKILFLVSPNSQTQFEDVANAESGEAIQGREEDIHVLQIDKLSDLNVARTTAEGLELRLSHAFLLRAGTVRDAERVTAEEIRELAQELEDAFGGVYTVLGAEFQLPLVKIFMRAMEDAGELPRLPKDSVEPVIITGFAALGRNHSVNKLRAFLADLSSIDPELTTVRKDVVAKRLGVGYGVEDLEALLKTPEELEQERQQAMAMSIAEKAAGPVAGAMARAE